MPSRAIESQSGSIWKRPLGRSGGRSKEAFLGGIKKDKKRLASGPILNYRFSVREKDRVTLEAWTE